MEADAKPRHRRPVYGWRSSGSRLQSAGWIGGGSEWRQIEEEEGEEVEETGWEAVLFQSRDGRQELNETLSPIKPRQEVGRRSSAHVSRFLSLLRPPAYPSIAPPPPVRQRGAEGFFVVEIRRDSRGEGGGRSSHLLTKLPVITLLTGKDAV